MSNINILRNNFFDIYSEIKLILLKHSVNENIDENKFTKIYDKLDSFTLDINKIKNNRILIQGFIDNNYGQIKEVKYFLINRKTRRSRSLHDRIFSNILKLSSYIPLGITFVFEDFIKGITFFNNEIENIKKIPIYRRSASCGNSSEDFQKKYFQCYNTNEPNEIKIKKEHIYKCYLERLIYNDMFKNLTFHFPKNLSNQELIQNKGHLFQLSKRSEDFNKCFLGIELNISIIYENNFPIILNIDYIKKNNIIKKEFFMKTTYIDDYGITRYHNDIFHKIIENNIEKINIQQFVVK